MAKKPIAYLTPQELRSLSQPVAWKSSLAIAADYAAIAVLFATAILLPNPLIWFICFVLIARYQLALAIMMHDASHRRLYSSPRWNDTIGQWLCAAPLFFSLDSYQKLHLRHHRAPLAPTDPDITLTGGYPIPRASFARKLLRDLFGISYFKFVRYFLYMSRKPKISSPTAIQRLMNDPTLTGEDEEIQQQLNAQAPTPKDKFTLFHIASSVLVVNAIFYGILWALGHPWFYLFFWVLPAMTALQVLLRIRGVAEHAGYAANEDQRLNARTVQPGWQTFLFAPHNVNFHIEHHVYPSVPFHNLPKLNRLFRERQVHPPANLFRDYTQVLGSVLKD